MEKVEEELIRKRGFIQGYPFKAPSKPVIKFRENSESSPFKEQGKLNEKNTPKIIVTRATVDSTSSNEAEFLELEKICCVEGSEKNNECARSPISSICNLLEGTVINSIKKNKVAFPNVLQNISKLENILTESKTAVEEYTINRERNISKITELLENDKKEYENLVMLQNRNNNVVYGILKELKCAFSNTVSDIETNKEENKENTPVHNRRSRRLLNKSPIQTDGAKLIVSPVVLKSKDLRKTTLTKNLVTRSQQYNIESPRLQKALDMYNSMRCEITLLATPKFDRNYLQESPRSSNLSRNLSRRVQNQCLLLQDTPIHK